MFTEGSSSSFGMSSTSSVSEDETVVQSTDTKEQQTSQNSHQKLRRQSSLSADDVTALLELNEFKPNYYSLDFSASPKHLKKEEKDIEPKFVWNKKSLRKVHSASKSDKLIHECRKLEASLRAMSSGSLDSLEAKFKDERLGNKNNGFDDNDKIDEENNGNGHLLSNDTDVMIADDKPLGVTLDWNVGDLETDDFEAEIPNPCAIYDPDFNGDGERFENKRRDSSNCYNHSGRRHSNYRTDSKQINQVDRSYHPKINPFMKQDSLDPYTFNNVLRRPSELGNEVVSYDVVHEMQDVLEEAHDVIEEVQVEFKLPSQNQGAKKNERSFFNAVKSKLLEMFDDKTDSKNKMEKSVQKKSLVTNHVKSPTSPLSKEQLDLASRLNFKVREFPLSSCPDVVHEGKISPHGNLLSDSGIDLENDNVASTNGARNHVKENWANETRLLGTRKTTSLEGKLFPDSCNEMSHKKCHSESALLNGIYDGYIKIDVNRLCENGDIGLTDFHGSALAYSETSYEHMVEMKGQGYEGENHDMQENYGSFYQEKLTEQYKMEEKRIDKDIQSASRQNSLARENCNELNGSWDKGCNLSGRTCRNGDTTSKGHYMRQRSRTESDVKEDDAVFELEDDEMSSKLCRYYHVFRKGEMENLISKHIPDLHIVQCFYDHANWCIIAEKR